MDYKVEILFSDGFKDDSYLKRIVIYIYKIHITNPADNTRFKTNGILPKNIDIKETDKFTISHDVYNEIKTAESYLKDNNFNIITLGVHKNSYSSLMQQYDGYFIYTDIDSLDSIENITTRDGIKIKNNDSLLLKFVFEYVK